MFTRGIAIICLLVVTACATTTNPEAETVLSGAELRVVIAHDAIAGRGPQGISDRFSLDGKMVAYININWPIEHTAWGTQTFESRWYINDKIVIKRETEFKIARSPFNFWSNALPITLGPGRGRYELYAGGKKLAEKTFEIVAPSLTPEAPRPPSSQTMLLVPFAKPMQILPAQPPGAA
jgi:hypothetical protein